MTKSWVLRAATFSFAILIIAALYWLTLSPPVDPCANPQSDVSAAVLAEADGDQEAMVNRALILQGKCSRPAGNQ